MLKELFGVNNKKIMKAKNERIDKQYYVDFHVTLDEAEESIRVAEEFISEVSVLAGKIKDDEISKYRQKVRVLMGA